MTAKASRSLGWEFHIDYFEDDKALYSSTFFVDPNGSIRQVANPLVEKSDEKSNQKEDAKPEPS